MLIFRNAQAIILERYALINAFAPFCAMDAHKQSRKIYFAD